MEINFNALAYVTWKKAIAANDFSSACNALALMLRAQEIACDN